MAGQTASEPPAVPKRVVRVRAAKSEEGRADPGQLGFAPGERRGLVQRRTRKVAYVSVHIASIARYASTLAEFDWHPSGHSRRAPRHPHSPKRQHTPHTLTPNHVPYSQSPGHPRLSSHHPDHQTQSRSSEPSPPQRIIPCCAVGPPILAPSSQPNSRRPGSPPHPFTRAADALGGSGEACHSDIVLIPPRAKPY